jgi:hypothetical protein
MAVIIGTTGNDNLVGTNSDDSLFGLSGNDALAGTGGNDDLIGGVRGPDVQQNIAPPLPAETAVQFPAVAGLAGGTSVVAWQVISTADAGDIEARVLNPDGAVRTAPFAVATEGGFQFNPSAAGLTNGTGILVWGRSSTANDGIWGRLVNPEGGLSSPFEVSTDATSEISLAERPGVAGLVNGGFAVAWSATVAGSPENIYLRRFDAGGTPLDGQALTVNTATGFDHRDPSVGASRTGGFFVTWDSIDLLGSGIYGTVYGPAGNGLLELRVSNPTPDSANLLHRLPSVTGTADGGYLVAWEALSAPTGDLDIFAKRFDANGNPASGEFRVNTTTANDQVGAKALATPDGGFAVIWSALDISSGSGLGVFGQFFDAFGQKIGGEVRFDASPTPVGAATPGAAATSDGGFVLAWDPSPAGSFGAAGIYSSRVWGDGEDTAVYQGAFRQYGLTGDPNVGTGQVTGPEGTDRLSFIENVAFVDGQETFDASGHMAQAYRLYFATLNRAPDALGLNFQSARLDAGVPLTNVAAGFVASPEFQAKYGALTDPQFVDLLYQNVLTRTAAPEEIAFHVNRLQAGASRSDIVIGFSEAPEHIQKHIGAVNAGLWDIDEGIASVSRLYFGMLERTPETNGLAFYKNALAGGFTIQQVANNFSLSPEFQAKYGPLDNPAYVTQLYLNVLDRTPAPEEVAFHVNRLAAGATRGDVAAGFTEAPEYQVKTLPLVDQGIAVADAGFVLPA